MENKFLSSAYKIRKFIQSKFVTEVYVNNNLKKSLKYANKNKADYAIILGEEEIKEIYTINLNTGLQNNIQKNLILDFSKMIKF